MATAVGIKNDGQRVKKRRATKFITTGNENHSNGQREFTENLCNFALRKQDRTQFVRIKLWITVYAVSGFTKLD